MSNENAIIGLLEDHKRLFKQVRARHVDQFGHNPNDPWLTKAWEDCEEVKAVLAVIGKSSK